MKKSVLLRKVFMVVVMTLALALLLTGAIYTLTSRAIFASIKANEMIPKARALGRLVELRGGSDAASVDTLLSFLRKESSVLGGSFIVVDGEGAAVAASDGVTDEAIASLDGIVRRALAGEEVSSFSGGSFFSSVQLVCVASPMRQNGNVDGAVLMIVPLYEALAAVSGMNSALMLSLLIIMPLIVVLVYYVIGRTLRPLRQMSDAAMGMAAGDFSIEADASQRGEVGQLAASLNYLSSELSHNLSELTIERNRLRQSVNGLREGFVSVNSAGRITYFNPAMREMYPGNDSTNDRMALVPDEALWQAFDRAIVDSAPAVYDLVTTDRVIRATINPVTGEDGQTVGAVGLFTDITESERLERTRRDYVANVSHELRTPLTAMRGLIEPLRDGMVKNDETRMRYYDILLRETLRLSRLIDDLMELSRLQSGKLSMEVRQVALSAIIEDLADKYTGAAREKNQTFRLLVDPSECPDVLTNADRAEQVLVILLDNAMKYTPEGGSIALDVREEDDRAVVSVSDTGVGIAKADLPYVFDRFYKADKSRTGSSGSGLGLSIAREILQSMGERIWVTSQPGQGSVFSFTLTLYSPREAEK
ncbi:MAG: HAMP domain-containing protein [Clostridia bacterium]|nr:HAMP domain-containing protein [Clostridia bacterium]